MVDVPDFNYSAFFYVDILEALVAFKRANVPELTDESEYEPYTQLLRAFACVGHLNNANLDVVANESTLPTAQLAEQVRNMLRLIDYEMSPASPAQVDVLYELSAPVSSSTELVSAGARVATRGPDAINFEANEAIVVDSTEVLDAVWAYEDGAFTDFTTEANSPGTDWDPWATAAAGDMVYFGHAGVLWDQFDVVVTSAMDGIVGIWEYYDGSFDKSQPDSVSQSGSSLIFVANGYLGNANRSGTAIRVKLNSTGAFEDGTVVWTGSANRVTIGLLGQAVPSVDPTDYTIGSDWETLVDVDDETNSLTESGSLNYLIPQQLDQNWINCQVNGVVANYVRFRVIEVLAPTAPTLQRVRIDLGRQYVVGLATQGLAKVDSPLGSSTGLPGQRFKASQEHFIKDSDVTTVDGVEWTRVESLLFSRPTDTHYYVELGENDVATFVFGDGVLGQVPPIGIGNISATYRVGADVNGNVGANTIIIDKEGLNRIERVTNPRPAAGWSEAEGASAASLERAKILGPRTLRDKEIAVGTSGLITLAVKYKDAFGAQPFSRVQAFEEGFGPKTVELIVVAKGGGLASQDQLDALELYFNGDKYAVPPVPSRFVSNQRVIPVNYQQRVINIVATVEGDVTESEIANKLSTIIQPEALKDDGVTYEWEFGGEVPRSRIGHEIHSVSEGIRKVTIVQPAADVVLNQRELPIVGSISITVV